VVITRDRLPRHGILKPCTGDYSRYELAVCGRGRTNGINGNSKSDILMETRIEEKDQCSWSMRYAVDFDSQICTNSRGNSCRGEGDQLTNYPTPMELGGDSSIDPSDTICITVAIEGRGGIN